MPRPLGGDLYLVQEAADSRIPDRPNISYSGPAGFPIDKLRFSSSAFSKGRGNQEFSGMEWRIGEIANPTVPGFTSGEPWVYEVEGQWSSGLLSSFAEEITLPAGELSAGKRYRARVRHFNVSGRASHWSEAIDFVAGEPDLFRFRDGLLISEIMYHPKNVSTAEFIELLNVGDEMLDLSNLRFSEGIDFAFPDGTLIQPRAYLLVVNDQDVFESVYGHSLPVVGAWESGDRLSNSGEKISLSFGAGFPIHEFSFGTKLPWPERADGLGPSLSLASPKRGVDHGDYSIWKASETNGGTPGRGVSEGFAGWLASFGIDPSDELHDQDGDGIPAIFEYDLGLDPSVHDASSVMTIDLSSGEALVRFRRTRNSPGLLIDVEYSSDLIHWEPTDQVVSEATMGDLIIVHASSIADQLESGFFRLRLERSNP